MIIKPGQIVKLDYDHPLIKGRVGCWVLNEKSGGLLRDACGHSNLTFAANAPRWIPGGLNFDSGVEYASGPHSPAFDAGTGGLTAIARMRTTYTTNPQYILSKNFGGSPAPWWGLGISDTGSPYNRTHFFWVAASTNFTWGPGGITDGAWHTIAGSRQDDGSLLTVWEDGKDATVSVENSTESTDSTGGVFLGARADLSASRDFVGDIEFSYLYTRELSADQHAWVNAEPYAGMNVRSPVFYLVLPSGGTVFNVAVTDGINMGEAVTAGTVFNESVSDGIAAGEVIDPAVQMAATVLDGVTLGDAAAAASVFGVAVTDSIVTGDSALASMVFELAVNDGLVLGEAIGAITEYYASVDDGLVIGDSAAVSATFNVEAVDGVQFGEILSAVLTFGVSVSDGITFSDSALIPSDASGLVTVSFAVKKATITFNVKRPTITATAKRPTITNT